MYLSRRFEGYSEQVADTISRRLLRGEEIPQREIDFSRGYAQALTDVFATPERVANELEHAARRAYRRATEMAEEAIGENSPYL